MLTNVLRGSNCRNQRSDKLYLKIVMATTNGSWGEGGLEEKMGCEAEKKAINKELSSHLSELRLEGTAISAVDFSNPCSACGNKKRRCLQPPTTFRKKVLIVEDGEDSDPISPCTDPYEEPGLDLLTDIKIQDETRKGQSGGCGSECTLYRRCSCKSNSSDALGLGLARSSSFVTVEKDGEFGDLSSPSGVLSRTTSVVTEDKGVIDDGRLSVTPIVHGKTLSPNDGIANKDNTPDRTPAASHHLLERNGSISTSAASDEILVRTGSHDPLSRNGSVCSLLTLPPIGSSSVLKFVSPDAKSFFTDDPSPVVDEKQNPNNTKAVCDYDANDVATGRGTVLSIDYHVQPAKKETTPSSGGRSSEKVKVSVRCQCGVYHKISF